MDSKLKNNNIEVKDFQESNIVEDSESALWLANTFIVFKSINTIFYLIYINKKNSIITYDMINNKKMNEIKNAHRESITNLRYYLDDINNRDLFLSISCEDNNIKLWYFYNFECLLDIKNIYKSGNILSSCFLKENNLYVIIASNDSKEEPIEVFDFKGNLI